MMIIHLWVVGAMSRYKYDIRQIKHAAAGLWLDILPQIVPELQNATDKAGRHVPCPVHGGTDGFRLFRDAASTGMGVCNTCHDKPLDGVGLIRWASGMALPDTLKAVSEALSGCAEAMGVQRAHPQATIDSGLESRRAVAAKQWGQSTPTPHEAARTYYTARGLASVAESMSVRYHAGLPYYASGRPIVDSCGRWITWPCIVGAMRGAAGRGGLLKIYLTKSGEQATAEIQSALAEQVEAMRGAEITCKPLLKVGGLSGSAVRLSPATDTLAVCEGLETALAVQQMTGLPVAACATATLLSLVDVPERVKSLLIYADNDVNGAGLRASEKLRDRVIASTGANVEILMPDILASGRSTDWLDHLSVP